MPPPDPVLSHVPALDGLRGLAVAAVVAFHAGFLPGGYLGVDLFFVLSGFLITRILIVDADEHGGVRLGRFYLRRFRRLAPALLVMVGVVAVVFADVADDGLASIFYYSNWSEISSGTDYWAALSGPSPLEHTWSLSIEEQVYLGWPLILMGATWLVGGRRHRARPTRVAIGSALVVGVVSVVVLILRLDGPASRLYYGTDVRVFAVMVGAVVAGLSLEGRFRPGRILRASSVVGLVAVSAGFVLVSGDDPNLHRGLLSGFGLASGLLIASLSGSVGGPVDSLLSWRPLRWLGQISYGLYLWHWPIFILVDGALVGIGLSVLAAVASYWLVEMPVRTYEPARPFLLGLPVAACVGLLVWNPTQILEVEVAGARAPAEIGGVDGREPSETGAMIVTGSMSGSEDAASPAPEALGRDAVDGPGGDPGIEAVDDAMDRPRVLLIGDSQAFRLAWSVKLVQQDAYVLASATFLGCGIGPGSPTSQGVAVFEDLDGTVCASTVPEWTQAVFGFDPEIVVVHAGAWDVLDRRIDGRDIAFGTTEWDDVTIDQIRVVNQSLGVEKREIVWLAVPCFDPGGRNGGHPARGERARGDRWNELVRQAAAEQGAYVLAYDTYTCEGPASDGSLGGREFRYDGVHLTEESAFVVWDWITAQPPFVDAG